MNEPAVLAMDIGGTNLRFALISRDGAILDRLQLPCRIDGGRDPFLADIRSGCEQVSLSAVEHGHAIQAVGAGMPGLIDRSGTVLSSVNLKAIDGFNIRQWLHEGLDLPAIVVNDANAAAMAEHRYGAGRTFGSILHFTLGTGVGSGLILDSRLWTGRDGVAAECGHMTVEPEGALCQCGNRGCLEQYASATAIARFARERLTEGVASRLAGLPPDELDGAAVAAAACEGDQLALDCFRRAGRYLGIAAASAVNMLNIEAIILGGGVAASFDLIAPAIRAEIEARAFAVPASRVQLLRGGLGDNAGILGGAAAAWELLRQNQSEGCSRLSFIRFRRLRAGIFLRQAL